MQGVRHGSAGHGRLRKSHKSPILLLKLVIGKVCRAADFCVFQRMTIHVRYQIATFRVSEIDLDAGSGTTTV